ncbi:hypothetical protein HPB47_012786, partial [Ixodes persulcatus]
MDVTDEAATFSSSTIVSACDDDDLQSNDAQSLSKIKLTDFLNNAAPGMVMTAFVPRDRSNSFGVLRDIDPDCTEDDVKTHLQSSVGITEVKRLGKKSPVIRVAFTGK